ncbi:MAG TPA: SAM-dependent methyltransferase [Micromonosporaceae bacterium]|nr:SAM-dependent methyltransferase [Micromonosporaceae bacterium]
MTSALYGERGFFVAGAGPGAHFRTSAHASALFAGAVLAVLDAVDQALGRPAVLDLVDVGAGRGELLRAVLRLAPPALGARLRPVAVELARRPADLPASIGWVGTPPPAVTGLVLATEWLDNVPLDVSEVDDAGLPRYVEVDASGVESPGDPVDGEDARWLARWWPLVDPGTRAEIGLPRDNAWASVLSTVERGAALCVDYGHTRDARPVFGTLAGFRDGRAAPPVPDGSGDLTAHLAIDALAARGATVAGAPPLLVTQRDALRALGVNGRRPPLELASRDPAGYLSALAAASQATELTDPAGLGGHYWLLQPVGLSTNWLSMARWRP